MTPRAATEELVERVLERIGDRAVRVVDVGTGSGAIAIALATRAPRAEIWVTDTSRCAVALASLNVRRHGLTDRVTVRRGDLLDPVPGSIDVVVANLPYLPTASAGAYPDLFGEPIGAVFAPDDGLDPYRRLAAIAGERLAPGGALVIQLHRRAIVAARDELDLLRAQLDRPQRASPALVSLGVPLRSSRRAAAAG